MAEITLDKQLINEIVENENLNEIDIKLETEYKEKKTKIINIIYIILFSIFGVLSIGLPFFAKSIKFYWICIVSAVMLIALSLTFLLFLRKNIKLSNF